MIVIIGILGAIVAVFIRAPIQGYADTVARAEAGDEADLALRRMAREIRLALPNSVRVNADGSAIEFLLTKTGGRYLAVEDAATSGTPLDFVNPATSASPSSAACRRPWPPAITSSSTTSAPAWRRPTPMRSARPGQHRAGRGRRRRRHPDRDEDQSVRPQRADAFSREPLPDRHTPVTYRCDSVGAKLC